MYIYIYLYICIYIYIYIYTSRHRSRRLPPVDDCAAGLTPRPVEQTVHVECAERGKKYGILFIFSLFCESIHLEYVRIHAV